MDMRGCGDVMRMSGMHSRVVALITSEAYLAGQRMIRCISDEVKETVVPKMGGAPICSVTPRFLQGLYIAHSHHVGREIYY
jgi:hypothetical protein